MADAAKSIEERALEWFAGSDTGVSSKSIARHMIGLGPGEWGCSPPWDVADFGRCARLLHLIPEWKPRIHEMAKYGRAWSALAENWDVITESFDREIGINWEHGRSAPETYALIQQALTQRSVSA